MNAQAVRAARQHPYFVEMYRAWGDHRPTVVGFQSEQDAREFARIRPEPIIDLVRRGDGVIANRRTVVHPDYGDLLSLRDDFPDTRG